MKKTTKQKLAQAFCQKTNEKIANLEKNHGLEPGYRCQFFDNDISFSLKDGNVVDQKIWIDNVCEPGSVICKSTASHDSIEFLTDFYSLIVVLSSNVPKDFDCAFVTDVSDVLESDWNQEKDIPLSIDSKIIEAIDFHDENDVQAALICLVSLITLNQGRAAINSMFVEMKQRAKTLIKATLPHSFLPGSFDIRLWAMSLMTGLKQCVSTYYSCFGKSYDLSERSILSFTSLTRFLSCSEMNDIYDGKTDGLSWTAFELDKDSYCMVDSLWNDHNKTSKLVDSAIGLSKQDIIKTLFPLSNYLSSLEEQEVGLFQKAVPILNVWMSSENNLETLLSTSFFIVSTSKRKIEGTSNLDKAEKKRLFEKIERKISETLSQNVNSPIKVIEQALYNSRMFIFAKFIEESPERFFEGLPFFLGYLDDALGNEKAFKKNDEDPYKELRIGKASRNFIMLTKLAILAMQSTVTETVSFVCSAACFYERENDAEPLDCCEWNSLIKLLKTEKDGVFSWLHHLAIREANCDTCI